MKKIKNLYIEEEKGVNFIVLEAEDGTLYKQNDVATGNCWVLYWVEQKEKRAKYELAKLILQAVR